MFQYNFCYCSIRIPPMPACLHGSFQYNFCYCSIIQGWSTGPVMRSFNTTFVTVLYVHQHRTDTDFCVSIQLLLLFYSCCLRPYRSHHPVSIQLLLLFYLCLSHFLFLRTVVSIQLLLLFYVWNGVLVSYIGAVSIQLLLLFYFALKGLAYIVLRCFNTTFVTVLSASCVRSCHISHCFNTTFVTVLSAFLLVSYFIISQDIP